MVVDDNTPANEIDFFAGELAARYEATGSLDEPDPYEYDYDKEYDEGEGEDGGECDEEPFECVQEHDDEGDEQAFEGAEGCPEPAVARPKKHPSGAVKAGKPPISKVEKGSAKGRGKSKSKAKAKPTPKAKGKAAPAPAQTTSSSILPSSLSKVDETVVHRDVMKARAFNSLLRVQRLPAEVQGLLDKAEQDRRSGYF